MAIVDTASFRQLVMEYYERHGRHDLPWRLPTPRGEFDTYRIVVSELMLQQTQVARVIPKFQSFLQAFPNYEALSKAPLAEVLAQWSGLGYNRRAKFLWQTAQKVTMLYAGELPREQAELVTLPGIGPNTAGAIMAYAYNQPVVFIETNIRTVFIHHFFAEHERVSDAWLTPLIETTLLPGKARQWYWALMDYGTYLKQTVGNTAKASTAYSKQSTFQGSRRQLRGQVLRALLAGGQTFKELEESISDARLAQVLESLFTEGMIERFGTLYQLRS